MQAINDLWIVGDAFVNSNYYMLLQLKNEAKTARRTIPYMYQFFNITCYTPNPHSLVKNTLARFVNCLIKALNDTDKLPCIILAIPDADLLRFICCSTDSDYQNINLFIEGALTWVINQMARAIKAKKDNIRRRRPGVVLPYEPKIIWVNMMDRLNGTSCTLGVFNDSLKLILTGRPGHFLLNIDQAMNDTTFFDAHNKLNAYGCAEFWNDIDKQVERFEMRQITLKPAAEATFGRSHHTLGRGR